MHTHAFHGFDSIPSGEVVSGLGVYRFDRMLTALEHLTFLSILEDAGMTSANGRLDRNSIPALPAIGLKQLFALGHCAPRTPADIVRQRRILERLQEELGLAEAWAFW